MARLPKTHPLVEGIFAIADRYRTIEGREGLFVEMCDRIRENWQRCREPARWPTIKNWKLRVTRDFSPNANKYIEKQLQKQIAIGLESEGWENDMPTASGLVDSRSHQLNVDIVHELTDGFEFFELRVAADTPYVYYADSGVDLRSLETQLSGQVERAFRRINDRATGNVLLSFWRFRRGSSTSPGWIGKRFAKRFEVATLRSLRNA